MFGTFRMLVAGCGVLGLFVGYIRFGLFMSRVGFCFGYFVRGKRFLSIALAVLRFGLDGLAGSFRMFGATKIIGFLGRFFLFQVGIDATNFRVGFGVSLNFFVLGFNQPRRERGRFFFAEDSFRLRRRGNGVLVNWVGLRVGFFAVFGLSSRYLGFGAGFGKQPAGQAPGGPAGHICACRQSGRSCTWR